jgi:hypothetical protein
VSRITTVPAIGWGDLPLDNRHRAELIASAISPAVARESDFSSSKTNSEVDCMVSAAALRLVRGLLVRMVNRAGRKDAR